MATYPGITVAHPATLLPGGTAPTRVRPTEPSLYISSVFTREGAVTDFGAHSSPSETFQICCLTYNHAANIYNRVWVLPSTINVGNLTRAESYSVEVWNAQYTGQTLNSITTDGIVGITLTEPASTPLAYAALQSRLYQVDVDLNGPAAIAATYTFNFVGQTPTLSLTGERLITLLVEPDWSSEFKETYQWLTDIIDGDDTTEQRIALRSMPRRVWTYSTKLWDIGRRQFDMLLWGWQARPYLLPVWYVTSKLTAPAAIGASTIQCDTDFFDFIDGGMVILTDGVKHETVSADTISTGQITLTSSLTAAWPLHTKVFPARMTRLESAQPLTSLSQDVVEATFKFRVEDFVPVTGVEMSATVYRGYPVLLQRPNWRGNIDTEFTRKVSAADFETYKWTVADKSGMPSVLQEYKWFRNGRDDIKGLIQWLHARAGACKMLWVPSFSPDVKIIVDVLAAQNVLDVQHANYSLMGAPTLGRRDLFIVLRSGTVIMRRVTAVEEVNSTTERLTLDGVLGVDFTANQVLYVSWMQISRIESDDIDLIWRTPLFVECTHRLKGLNHDA